MLRKYEPVARHGGSGWTSSSQTWGAQQTKLRERLCCCSISRRLGLCKLLDINDNTVYDHTIFVDIEQHMDRKLVSFTHVYDCGEIG